MDLEKSNAVYDFNKVWTDCLLFNAEQKPEEFKSLLDFLVLHCNRGNALEIGSNYGGTTVGLCHIFNKVITVDIKHNTNFDKLKEKFLGYQYIIADSKSNNIVNILKMLGIKFDFIFIDGDHSYEGVKSDYEKYKQFLSPTGYIAFHDIVSSDTARQYNIYVDKLWKECITTYSHVREYVSPVRNESYRMDDPFHNIIKNSKYDSWGGIGLLKNSPVGVFCHNYLNNGWRRIVNSQLSKLVISRLYNRADKIIYGVYSNLDTDFFEFTRLVQSHDKDNKIQQYHL
jgi:predicted O-methyltransferase YrrM